MIFNIVIELASCLTVVILLEMTILTGFVGERRIHQNIYFLNLYICDYGIRTDGM